MDDFATLGYFSLHFMLHGILKREIHLLHISRVLIPLAYKANIWSSNILALRCPFFTMVGSKVELWSCGVLNSILPSSV